MKRALGFVAFWISAFLCFANDEPKFKVTEVIDGNTIQVISNDGEKTKILLHGVDSPEDGQKFSAEAKLLLESLLLNKQVTLIERGKDRTGTRLAEVNVEGVADPRHELIRSGLAWTTTDNQELEAMKEHARKLGMGLWQDENPTPPWIYRRQQSMMKAKTG